MNLVLPDGDGKALVQRIRSDGLSTRVAVCIGRTHAMRIADAIALGPDLVLYQPVDRFALLGALGTFDGN